MTSIVLAGGRSSRLGLDKSTVAIAGGSLIQQVIARLIPLSSEIIVVLSQEQEKPPLPSGVKVAFDTYPGGKALGGIYSGLMASGDSHNLVVACDMPLLNVDLLRYMFELSPGFDVVIPRTRKGLEPLHAIYSKGCLHAITQLLEEGNLKITDFLSTVKVRYVEESEVDRFDPQHLSFFNINTKNDLSRAEELINALR